MLYIYIHPVSFLFDRNFVYLLKSVLWWNYLQEMFMTLFLPDCLIKWMSLFKFKIEYKKAIFGMQNFLFLF